MDDGSTRSVRAVVHGGVQGVGFRWATRGVAERLGLVGSVRNLDDGTVEVRAQGAPDALDELARWLQHGPRGARVERVEAAAIDPLVTEAFTIER